MQKDEIVESVINEFRLRSERGIKKYGTTLQENELSQLEWLKHLQEELMDAVLYLEKVKQINQSKMETKQNGGAIFKNEKKADTHPDYKGTINVDGQDKEIALWVKQSAKGTTYFSVKISEPYKKTEEQPQGKWIKPEQVKNDLPF